MKNRTIALIALLIISALFFDGCMKPTEPGQTAANLPSEGASEAPPNTSEMPSTMPDPPSENQYLWLVNDGETVMPYKAFWCGATYVEPDDKNEGGMLHADGVAFFQGILSAEDEFPEVGKDFEIVLWNDCRITGIRVYDRETHERLHEVREAAELKDIVKSAEGDLIVNIVVRHEGKYIESLDKNEFDAYVFAFTVKCEKAGLPKLSHMTEEELRETLIGLGVEIPDEPPFGIKYLIELFENDIDAPYPSDVYFDSAHMFFESVRAAVKEYYGIE